MAGTFTTSVRFFTPASATTTGWQGVADETTLSADSADGLNVYTGYVDIAASDEVIAQALGENFVPSAEFDPAGDLVARAREFARELPQVGMFLARAGILAADGATGAGAGAGVAVAAARSAAIFGDDGLFADGETRDPLDLDEQSGQLHGTPSAAQPRQTPEERLAAHRANIARLVAEGEALEKEGKTEEARTKFKDAALIYDVILSSGLLTRSEFNSTLEAEAVLFDKAGDSENAQRTRESLRMRQEGTFDEVRPESPGTANFDTGGAIAAARPTPEITPPYVFAEREIRRLAGVLTGPGTTLFHVIESLPYGRVVRALRTAVNNWVERNGTRKVSEDWFGLEFTGLLEDRGAALAVATPQGAQGNKIISTELLITIATNWYVRQINNPESPIYNLLPTGNSGELEATVRELVRGWYDIPVEGRLEWSNRPDVVPVNWFVSEANKTRDRSLTEKPLVPWKGRSVKPTAVAGIVPTYLLEEKEVRKYLILAQNTEGPLSDLNLGDDPATREGVIRAGVEAWFAQPLAERTKTAPYNPDDMPIGWFRNWLLWMGRHG